MLRRDREATWFPASEGVPLANDGSFTVPGGPPGDWDVIVQAWCTRPGSNTSSLFQVVVGTVAALGAGDLRVLDLDVAALVPGSLTVMVRDAGMPAADRDVWLHLDWQVATPHGFAPYSSTRAHTDGEGRCVLRTFPVVVGVSLDDIPAPGTAVLRSGADTTATFDVGPPASLTLRFVDGDGRPVPRARVAVQVDDEAHTCIADAAGLLAFPRLPPGRYRIGVLPAAAGEAEPSAAREPPTMLGAIEVPYGANLERRFTVPAGLGY